MSNVKVIEADVVPSVPDEVADENPMDEAPNTVPLKNRIRVIKCCLFIY